MNDKILQIYGTYAQKLSIDEQRIYFMAALFMDNDSLLSLQERLKLPADICTAIQNSIPSMVAPYQVTDEDRAYAMNKWGNFISQYLRTNEHFGLSFTNNILLANANINRPVFGSLDEIKNGISTQVGQTLLNSVSSIMQKAFLVNNEMMKYTSAVEKSCKDDESYNGVFVADIQYTDEINQKTQSLIAECDAIEDKLREHVGQCEVALDNCFKTAGFVEETQKRYTIVLTEREAIVALFAKIKLIKEVFNSRYGYASYVIDPKSQRPDYLCRSDIVRDVNAINRKIVSRGPEYERMSLAPIDLDRIDAFVTRVNEDFDYLNKVAYPCIIEGEQIVGKNIQDPYFKNTSISDINDNTKQYFLSAFIKAAVLEEKLLPDLKRRIKVTQDCLTEIKNDGAECVIYDVLVRELTAIRTVGKELLKKLQTSISVNGERAMLKVQEQGEDILLMGSASRQFSVSINRDKFMDMVDNELSENKSFAKILSAERNLKNLISLCAKISCSGEQISFITDNCECSSFIDLIAEAEKPDVLPETVPVSATKNNPPEQVAPTNTVNDPFAIFGGQMPFTIEQPTSVEELTPTDDLFSSSPATTTNNQVEETPEEDPMSMFPSMPFNVVEEKNTIVEAPPVVEDPVVEETPKQDSVFPDVFGLGLATDTPSEPKPDMIDSIFGFGGVQSTVQKKETIPDKPKKKKISKKDFGQGMKELENITSFDNINEQLADIETRYPGFKEKFDSMFTRAIRDAIAQFSNEN